MLKQTIIALSMTVMLVTTAQADETQKQNCEPQFTYSKTGASKYCTACHGDKGQMSDDKTPKIAGMPKEYLKKQMIEFKSGKRVSAPMNAVMPYVTNDEIEELAEFFSKQ
jgi:cytochrome c553